MVTQFTQSPAGLDVARVVPLPERGCLSEVASQGINRQRKHGIRSRPWREDHVVDQAMRDTFAEAVSAIASANCVLDRGVFRVNVLLTLNAEDLARKGETPQAFHRWITKQLRNLYRKKPHTFAGVWRYEFGTFRYGKRHYHIAFHLPRGMRKRLLKALQKWFDEPLDADRSLQSFNHPKWQVRSVNNGWHLRRIYDLESMLDYMAKVPKGPTGEGVSRDERLKGDAKKVREYGTFGHKPKRPVDEGKSSNQQVRSKQCRKKKTAETQAGVSPPETGYGARGRRMAVRPSIPALMSYGRLVSDISSGTTPIRFSSIKPSATELWLRYQKCGP